MKNINNFKLLSCSKEIKNIELKNKATHRKNKNQSRNKIYSFKTSLFTEKSKNFIENLNSAQKTYNKNIEINGNKTFKKDKKSFSLKQKNETIKDNFNNNNVHNINNDYKDNIFTRKSSSLNLFNNKIACHIKKNNKIEYKNKNIYQNMDNQNINFKILNNMNNHKLFTSLSNVNIINFIPQNQSMNNTCLANVNLKKKYISSKKETKKNLFHNIILKLKSNKSLNKKIEENHNLLSLISVNNDNDYNVKKTLKKFKSISKRYKIRPFSNYTYFDKKFFISRNQLGNYLTKKNNNRYNNNNIIIKSKINLKRYIQSGVSRNNIFSLNSKDN